MNRYLLLICLALISVVLSGCWDSNELNDLAVSVGMGLDKKGNKVQVSTQIVNPSEVATKRGGGYSAPVTTFTATERTTLEALRKITSVSPRKVFSSHLRILVIGEALARNGVAEVMDSISRNHELRSDFYIIVPKGTTAKSVLSILNPIEKIPSNKMFSSLEVSEGTWAPAAKVELFEFMADLSDPSKENILTGIRIAGDASAGNKLSNVEQIVPSAILQYSGIAVFKGDRLVDWLNQDESKGYNYIVGNVKNSIGHIRCPDGNGVLTVDVTRTISKIKGILSNGKPKIKINLFIEENVAGVQCQIDLTKPETIREIEDLSNQKLTTMMESAIRKAQRNKADIFGFGQAIENAHPRQWQKLKNDWPDRFSDLDVDINVDTRIRRLGTTSNSAIESWE
ncbi:Ger(x)C family spore germination protein [Paenibacillus montanisoli]|uniref:Ger(X)C family spore germination protein n=1 Tax=Paenibacillus montanisoli TaxID=2081970 RepID=A0A328U4B3_9BACL|nr:Ger(x)C family spore germination protein [Paenibacillus montanisoli]RAP75745.1 Ger(x)C family spore germination protein [Paenibacillus montanisoli]